MLKSVGYLLFIVAIQAVKMLILLKPKDDFHHYTVELFILILLLQESSM
jgi:hypothetical protein